MKNFFPNKTALKALIAACFVVCATMGVRQTFGLYSSEFETTAGTSNTEFGLAIGIQMLGWGLSGPIFGAIADKYSSSVAGLLGVILFLIGLCDIITFQRVYSLF